MSDPLSIIAVSSSILTVIDIITRASRFANKASEVDTNLLTTTRDNCYLEIRDFHAESTGHPSTDLLVKATHPRDLDQAFQDLPEQAPCTLRVYVCELNSDNTHYKSILEQVSEQHTSTQIHHGLPGVSFPRNDDTQTNHWSSLKGYGYASSVGYNAKDWATIHRSILLKEGPDDRRIALVSCTTAFSKRDLRYFNASPDRFPFALTEMFAARLALVMNTYTSVFTTSDWGGWRRAVILGCYQVGLYELMDFLRRFETEYVEPRMKEFDARVFKLRPWHLKEITKDSYFYQDLHNLGEDIVSTTETLLAIFRASATGSGGDESTSFAVLEAELRGVCKNLALRTTRLSKNLRQTLEFLSLARDISQTSSLQTLTILATIFLPMSLAAGILSMQVRLKDLRSILYDFFGVLVLLVTFVVFFVVCMSIFDIVRNQRGIERYHFYRKLEPYLKAVFAVGFLMAGALILASFLVGMFMNVVLGAKILGFGLIGPAAILVGIGLLGSLVAYVLC